MILPIRASNYHRAITCPGSIKLEATLPEPPESEEATEGTLLHLAMAGHEVELTDDQKTTIEIASRYRDQLIKDTFGEGVETKVIREKLIELKDDKCLNIIFSGHADEVHIADKVLVIDYKFGRIPVEAADQNYQIRAYALMSHLQLAPLINEVIVAIIQPRLKKDEAVTIAIYQKDELDMALEEMDRTSMEVNHPSAPYSPSGDACRYCRAKSVCPAALEVVDEVACIESNIPAHRIEWLLERAEIAEKIVKEIKSKAKEMLEADPESVPGYRLKPGANQRTITDPTKAFNRLSNIITGEEFSSACTVSIGD